MPSVDSMIHHVFYSLYSGRRVTHKWAMKYPKLVTRVTLYGKVDEQFLKRGIAMPVTLRQALRAEAFQLEQCGATKVPLATHYFNRRTKKKVTSRSYRRDPDNVGMYIYPIAYGEPKTALEANMAQATWGTEVHQMRMKLALDNFKQAVTESLQDTLRRSSSISGGTSMDTFIPHGMTRMGSMG